MGEKGYTYVDMSLLKFLGVTETTLTSMGEGVGQIVNTQTLNDCSIPVRVRIGNFCVFRINPRKIHKLVALSKDVQRCSTSETLGY